MTSRFESWRRNLLLWSVPLAFCVINLLILAFYRSFYAGDVERLERRHQQVAAEVQTLEQESQQIEEFLDRVEVQQTHVERLFDEHFLSEAERFTEAIKEVKRLAREAGLDPTAFSYPQLALEDTDLIQRGIVFTVEGTYRQLRTFINFLELTDQFLTLNDVSLSGGGEAGNDPRLSIRLQLSTVFVNDGTRRIFSDDATPASGEST